MNVEPEKVDKINPNREMTVKNEKRKNRHPELARYQPPISRNALNQNQTPQNINKDSKNSKLSREKSPEVSKTLHQEQQEKNLNFSSGGLIKLDKKALDKIINKNKASNNNEVQENDEIIDSERYLVLNSDRLQSNESRTLFNPDNPDKPILVDLKSRKDPSLKSNIKSKKMNENNKK